MRKAALFVSVLTCALSWCPTPQADSKHFLTPAEMAKAMETSKTVYKLDLLKSLKDMGPEQFADAYWPSSKHELQFPWVSDDGKGGLTLTSYPFDAGVMGIVKKAEAAFEDKKYDRAAKLYEKALKDSPKCYYAYIGLGDCHFFMGDLEQAIDLYQKAIDLNPYDFRGFFFKGHALLKLGQYKEAKEYFIQTLTLQPHRKSVIATAKTYADRMGVQVNDDSFLPRSLARLEGETVAIYSDPDAFSWFYHAICKGFWLGEPSHRMELTGHEEHRWSTSEELECLAALVIGYEQVMSDGNIAKDPAIERIKAILDDGMLSEFVYYDIYARLSPGVVLLLPASERDKLRQYVAKYVLVPSDGSDAGKAAARDDS